MNQTEIRVVKETGLSQEIRRSLGAGGTALLLSMSPVVSGDSTFGAVFELLGLDGSEGFVINGVDAGDNSGTSISGAGDVNGDGVADVIIWAPRADQNGKESTGESYVVFGGGSLGGTGMLELSSLDGSDGFVINGIDALDGSGRSVSTAGDVNGDGLDDLIISASGADPNGSGSGVSYVLFGGGGLGNTGAIDLSELNGSNGFVINGVDERDSSGSSVSGAGDINGDGLDDLIIGASRADPNGSESGESYVLFGGGGVGSGGSIELSDLDGSNGL